MWVKIQRNTNYSINKKGQVRNDNTGRLKKATLSKKNGYLYIDLYDKNKRKKFTLHRLMAEAFIPNPENKPCIDHIDKNRKNCSIKNLRWVTFPENNKGVRSEKIASIHYKEKRKKRGGGHEKWLDIDVIKYFDCISDAAKYFKVCLSNISLMLEKGTIGRRGKMRGYKFEYTHNRKKYFRKRVTTIETEKSV